MDRFALDFAGFPKEGREGILSRRSDSLTRLIASRATIVCRYPWTTTRTTLFPGCVRVYVLYITEIETFPYYYERGHRLIPRYYKPRPRSTKRSFGTL